MGPGVGPWAVPLGLSNRVPKVPRPRHPHGAVWAQSEPLQSAGGQLHGARGGRSGRVGNNCQAPAPVVLGVSQSRCVSVPASRLQEAILGGVSAPEEGWQQKQCQGLTRPVGQPVRVPAVLLALPAQVAALV